MTDLPTTRSPAWKWYICGLLLLATMINYMDRQTLSLLITDISKELNLSNEDYGNLEFGFGIAFAVGGIVTGFIVDLVSVRWMYPAVLLGWSLAGILTGWATSYQDLMICRIMLGFFEAGQWPCALTVSQRLLSAKDRTLGNSVLQSGASFGAILTPLVIQTMVTPGVTGSWRSPFLVIGALGIAWIVPWLLMIRESDLKFRESHETAPVTPAADPAIDPAVADISESPSTNPYTASTQSAESEARTAPTLPSFGWFVRHAIALFLVVVTINLCWHFFRAWLPKFLREFHGYSPAAVNGFVAAYYISTDVGCILAGFAVRKLAVIGWQVRHARLAVFLVCAVLTALSTVASGLPAGPLLLGVLLLIGAGSLGLFPNYYSYSQELAPRHQGKVTGILGASTWVITAVMHPIVGKSIDATGSYASGVFWIGLLPMVGFFALLILWTGRKEESIAKTLDN